MTDMVIFGNLKELIIEIRSEKVLLDSDVAVIYGVETKRVNEAVKNNPDKFPGGYIMELDKNEWDSLKSKFSTSTKGGKVKLPSAFTEKGLYMLATILKSSQATQATISISDAETSIELNFAVLKFKHTIKKKRGK
jgi:hypothetical protein